MEQELSEVCNTDSGWQVETFIIPGVAESVKLIRQNVIEFASSCPFTSEELMDLELAVGEACTNAVKHGSPRGDQDNVNVKCLKKNTTLVVEITDHGSGFDPKAIKLPNADLLPGNGFGLYLMRQLVDTVEFAFSDGTTVRLVKHCGCESDNATRRPVCR